jgi:N-acyl-D-amino-acid deacylase
MDLDKGSILFKSASVVDGTGQTPAYQAHVLVQDGTIQSIQPIDKASNTQSQTDDTVRVVNCEDGKWTLSPGFIDMHAHSDLSLLHTPKHLAKITQGVTTEVIGQDGISYSPVTDYTMARIRKQIAGWNGNPTDSGFFERWRSVKEYLDVLDESKIATNAAYLVPQGNLRMLVKGWDSAACTQAEIDTMKDHLHEAFKGGAVGMSSGLTYVPGMFADTSELTQLCRVVKQYDGYFCPHHRSYGKNAIQAYAEMLDLARKTGVRLHFTHATLNFPENAGRADELIAMIDKALEEGLDITLDTYPYLPGSTTLAALLPSWVSSASNKHEILSDPTQLSQIRHQALVEGTDGCYGCTLDWDIIEIGGVQDPSLAPARRQNSRPNRPFAKSRPLRRLDLAAQSRRLRHDHHAARRPRSKCAENHEPPRAHRRVRRDPDFDQTAPQRLGDFSAVYRPLPPRFESGEIAGAAC